MNSATPLLMNESSRSQITYSFDRLFLERLFGLLRVLFWPTTRFRPWSPSNEARERSLFWLYCTFFVLSCGNECLVYYTGLIPSRFYAILTAKDASQFSRFMAPCIVLVLSTAAGKGLVDYMGGLFALKVRRLLTLHLHRRYIKHRTVYALTNHPSVDNPDQRITQDIEKFAETLKSIVQTLIIAPILILIYTWQCWTVSGALGPSVIYAYFILGSTLSHWFIKPIVDAVFRKELQEGNFRFLHVRLCQFAESIAFNRGEAEEKMRAHEQLDTLLDSQRAIINNELPLHLVNRSFAYFGSILSYLVVAIPIFMGVFDDKSPGELSAIISKNAFVSMYLIFLFTTILEQSSKLSDLAGYTARVGELLEAIDANDHELEKNDTLARVNMGERVVFDNVSIRSPHAKLIVSSLNVTIEKGQHTIFTGQNGSGKSSILRALAGLWPCSKGQICILQTSRAKDLLFLPQLPYLIHGSLRDQITYPSLSSVMPLTDQEVFALLEQVDLVHLASLVDNFDTPYRQQWTTFLSPGEQQRLIFARVLFWKPRFVVLDEATSAMDSESEDRMYRLLQGLDGTLISVSHHPSVISYHHQEVQLDGRSGYKVQSALG